MFAAIASMVYIWQATLLALRKLRLLTLLEMSLLASEIHFVAIVANVLIVGSRAIVVLLFI